MAQIALRAGRQVVIATSCGPESLTATVEALGTGVSAGTVKQAAAGDVVVVAVMWPQVARAVGGLDLADRIVIDPTNDFEPSDLDGRTSSEVAADLVARARVVKAANTLAAAVLGSDPGQPGGQRVIFLSGDDRGQRRGLGAVRGRRLLRHQPWRPARRRSDAAVRCSAGRPEPDPTPLTQTGRTT
jgi:predicted dinucleotide-binding enzyme